MGATLLLPCAMLHPQAIRDVSVQCSLFCLLIGNAVMQLESMALWRWKAEWYISFSTLLMKTPFISDIEQAKGYLNAEHDH